MIGFFFQLITAHMRWSGVQGLLSVMVSWKESCISLFMQSYWMYSAFLFLEVSKDIPNSLTWHEISDFLSSLDAFIAGHR